MSYGGDYDPEEGRPLPLSSSHRDYVYVPCHLVYGELCMILQTRYFRLRSADARQQLGGGILSLAGVTEIALNEYDSRRSPWDKRYPYAPRDVVSVREIVFGPMGGRGSNPALWFDLSPSDVVRGTPQLVKRFRRFRQRTSAASQQRGKHILGGGGGSENASPPSALIGSSSSPPHPLALRGSGGPKSQTPSFRHPTHQPFFHPQPALNDHESFGLIRNILMHRIDVLRSRSLVGAKFADSCAALSKEEGELRRRFEVMKGHTVRWSWPKNMGRESISEETEVPRCSGLYKFRSIDRSGGKVRATAAGRIWDSFVGHQENKVLPIICYCA